MTRCGRELEVLKWAREISLILAWINENGGEDSVSFYGDIDYLAGRQQK